MPFKEIKAHELVKEKRKNKEFNSNYLEVEKEYELIKKIVDAIKEKGISQKTLAEKVEN